MKTFILFATFYLTIYMSSGKTVNVERFNVSNVVQNNTDTKFNPIESIMNAAVEAISRISNILNPSTEESTVTKTDSITFPANENAALFGATDDVSIDWNLSTQELKVVESNSTEEDITTMNPWKPIVDNKQLSEVTIVNNVSDNVIFADEKTVPSNTNITEEKKVVENNSTEEDITTVNPWKPIVDNKQLSEVTIVNNVSDNVTFADEKSVPSNTNLTEEKKVVENNSTEEDITTVNPWKPIVDNKQISEVTIVNNVSDNVTFADEKSVSGNTNITEEKKVTDNVIFTDVNNVSEKNISNDNVVVCEDKGERLDINQHSCCKYYTGMIETWLGNFEQYDYKCFHPKTGEQVEDPLARCVEKDYLLVCCDEAGKCTGYNGPHLTDPLCFYYEGSQACAK